jgi:hypothetical protein
MQEPRVRNQYNDGRRVIVRAFGNRALIRRILRTTKESVIVCHPTLYDDIVAGDRPEPMVCFPIADVFTLSDGVELREGDCYDDHVWRTLTPVGALTPA